MAHALREIMACKINRIGPFFLPPLPARSGPPVKFFPPAEEEQEGAHTYLCPSLLPCLSPPFGGKVHVGG